MFNSFPQPRPDSGVGNFVKSVQRGFIGVVAESALTIPISSVDVNKTIVSCTLRATLGAGTAASLLFRGDFADPTTLTLNRGAVTNLNGLPLHYQVVEFTRPIQTGIITIASPAITGTATISPVTSRAFVLGTISSTNTNASSGSAMIGYWFELTDSTTITVSLPSGSNNTGTVTARYYVIDA